MNFLTQLHHQMCGDELARRQAEALEIILAVDALRLAHKKYKVHISAAQGAQTLSAPLGTSGHAPPPPPTAGTTTTAAGSLGQQTLTSSSDEGGK